VHETLRAGKLEEGRKVRSVSNRDCIPLVRRHVPVPRLSPRATTARQVRLPLLTLLSMLRPLD
jgi:hypothetical protein